MDLIDWTLRFDGRTSPTLLEALRGPVGAALLGRVRARDDLLDLRLRREAGGRAHAALHAGATPLLHLTEQGGGIDVRIAGAVLASGLDQRGLVSAWPGLEAALGAAEEQALLAQPTAADRLEARLGNGADPSVAVLARRLVPDVGDSAGARGLRERITGPLVAALERHRGGPLGSIPPEAPALLAVDERRALLVVEVADPVDLEGAEVALVRARWWAELLGHWTGDDALARIRLLDLLEQRRELGLVRTAVDELVTPLRIIPVLALGPTAPAPEGCERLDALARELRASTPSHPAVQRPERWVVDGAGRRVVGDGAAA